MSTATAAQATNLKELIDSGWNSKTVKQEIRENFLKQLAGGEELYPGIVGYENTVIPKSTSLCCPGMTCFIWAKKVRRKAV